VTILAKEGLIRKKGAALTRLLKYIHERDNYCALCGDRGTEVHHIRFKSQRGSDTKDNLILLCLNCHRLAHSDKARSTRERCLDSIKKKEGLCKI
jgi:5-methylcytosine-specific restriction endonuclease McrA